jgi:hypothetical protein
MDELRKIQISAGGIVAASSLFLMLLGQRDYVTFIGLAVGLGLLAFVVIRGKSK